MLGDLRSDDRGLPYIGALFYIFSEWNFPEIGLGSDLSAPYNFSLIYVDNFPLVSIVFKIFRNLIGRQDFQYLGIVTLINQVLMSGISSALVSRATKSKSAGVVASLFFIFNYPYLSRMFVHFGLQAQWLLVGLLYFFYFVANKKVSTKMKCIFYALMGGMTVLVHLYFLPPIMISIVFFEMGNIKDKKDFMWYIAYVGNYVIVVLFTFWLLGGTYGKMINNTGILGQQSSNLNTFWNPMGSNFFKHKLPLSYASQYNGSAYIGLGFFIVMLCVTVGSIVKYKGQLFVAVLNSTKKNWNILLGFLALFLFSLSPTVSFNENILFTIPLPGFVTDLWGCFRACGRTVWIIVYALIIFFVCKLFKLYKFKSALLILIICAGLQFFEYTGMLRSYFEPYVDTMEEDAWEQLAQSGKDKIIVMNGANRNNVLKIINNIGTRKVYDLAKFAFLNHMTVNDFYFARTDQQIGKYREEVWEQLYAGTADEKAIYVFVEDPIKLVQDNVLNFYMIDGYFIGITDTLHGYERINADDDLSVKPLLGTMLKGGSYVDGKRIIKKGGVSTGPDIPINKGNYTLKISGTGLDSAVWAIVTKEPFVISDTSETDELIVVHFKLDSDTEHFSVTVSNNGPNDTVIENMTLRWGKD